MATKTEKRRKTKVIQVRLTPLDFESYEQCAKQKGMSKTELFEVFLQMIKDRKI